MADILIGLGGTGGKILKAFRQRLWTEHDEAQRSRLPIGYIYVDTDSAMLNPEDVTYQTIHGNCCFQPSDFVDIKTQSNIDAIFGNPQGYKRLLGLLGNVGDTQAAVCPVGAAADQKRRAGRILFAANIDAYLSKLARVVEEVKKKEVGSVINVHIFAGLAGGTGSGSVVDAIAQTRKWFHKNNIQENTGFKITVFCQIPENMPPATWDTGRYKANGYAALTELNNLFTSHYNQAWKTATAKPCFDVSADVDFGRMYLTYDNPTPENVREGRIPQEVKIAGGLILYSNTNDYGHTVTNPIELAGLVADFVYTCIFTKSDLQEQFNRFYSFENLGQNRDEYDENADPDLTKPIPVRTRCVGSFGIKRIVVPETDLQEHIAYTLGCRALYQLKYNNWSSNQGYIDEPRNFDPVTYIRDEGRRANWKMDQAHLMLKQYILEGDATEKWAIGEFNIYWDNVVNQWADAAKGTEHPFDRLIELCRGGYEKGFRGKGVENFYNDKARSIANAYAKQIADNVERYLFKEWAEGRLSLNEISEVSGLLKKEIRETGTLYTEKTIPELEAEIKGLENHITTTVDEYLGANMIKRPLIFGNRYERVMQFAKSLYRKKTEVAALRLFAVPLAQALEVKFSDINNRVIGFVQAVDDVLDFVKERMVALSDINAADEQVERDGSENITLPVIKFYSRNRMLQLENKLIKTQDKMNDINELVRNAIVNALNGDGRFTNVHNLGIKAVSGALLGDVYKLIKTFHEVLCTERTEKVLGMPVLERLAAKYSNDDQGLSKFARDIITASGVFTEINMNEIQLNNANTDAPVIGQNILMKRILVNLPKAQDPDLVAFAERFKEKLENAIPGTAAGSGITISTEGGNENEISITTLYNGYPMRAISAMPMLKAEYDKLISANPANKIVLLTEGRHGDFRSLFACPPKSADEIRNEIVPKMIICLAIEKLMLDEGESEEYGTVKQGLFSAEVEPWGFTKFTEMCCDDRLITERATAVRKLYSEGMDEQFEDVEGTAKRQAKQQEIIDKMMAAMKKVLGAEAPERARIRQFEGWAVAAMELIKTYK